MSQPQQTSSSFDSSSTSTPSSNTYIPRHLLSAHLHEMVNPDFLNRFLSLESSRSLIGGSMKDVFGDEFSKLVFDCVYYYEEALVEEQNTLYSKVKAKIQQYMDNQEENEWAKEHHVFIGDDEAPMGSMGSETTQQYTHLLAKLDELKEQYETKLPSIGDRTRLIDVLDDLHVVLLSAEDYKMQLLSLLDQASGRPKNRPMEKLSIVSHHHPHAHLKYNDFNTMIGGLEPSEELFSRAKEYVETTFEIFEKWQRDGMTSVDKCIQNTSDESPNHSPSIDTTPYDLVLKQYSVLFYDLYRRVLDSFRCVSLFAVTVANSDSSKIVFIGSTTDIKKNFVQFRPLSFQERTDVTLMLELCAKLLHPKYEGYVKKIHLFTLDENHHRPVELNPDAPFIIGRVAIELHRRYAPEMNMLVSGSSEYMVDSSSLDKIHHTRSFY
ncbi:hypothetical protein FDP41_001536 [Naegleria fowleri]|uniref:Uncharacterized protein n=1 Tax=Naegleria fowleri TaxID=5763 RepID=A0A6A5BMF4_NAEFO|nr:uncharacterized protein FDP41_001536 [Naegleria fowleri]KAF0979193.1 hypothetical protein FDP41_001536 [Naegleria fowleri]CAG4717197.1 unnamed protein product [Naegleria fowleri]